MSGADTLDAVAVRLWQNDATSVSAVFDATAPSFTYTPTTGGTYYIERVGPGGTGVWQDKTGDFQISLVDQGIVITDTVREGTDTTATLGVGATVNGTIDQNGIDGADLTIDKDWYAVTLIAGHTYTFSATAGVSGADTLDAVAVRLWQNDATSVSAVFDATAPSFTYTPTTGGTYYLAVSAGGTGVWQDKTGDFQISLVDQGIVITDTVREGTDTTATLGVGATVNGTIDQNGIDGADLTIDKDWYAVTLIAGHTYTFSATAGVSGADTLDAVAVRLWQNDATSVSAVFDATAPSFTYTPTTGGTYYLAVSAGGTGVWQDKTGDFQISLVDQGASGPERLHVRCGQQGGGRERWHRDFYFEPNQSIGCRDGLPHDMAELERQWRLQSLRLRVRAIPQHLLCIGRCDRAGDDPHSRRPVEEDTRRSVSAFTLTPTTCWAPRRRARRSRSRMTMQRHRPRRANY